MRRISSFLNASATLWPDLLFTGRTQASFENMSIQISKNFTSSLWPDSFCVSTWSAWHMSWIPLVNVCLRLKRFSRGLCRVYASALINQLFTSPFKYFSAAEKPPILRGCLLSEYNRFINANRTTELTLREGDLRGEWDFRGVVNLRFFQVNSLATSALSTIPRGTNSLATSSLPTIPRGTSVFQCCSISAFLSTGSTSCLILYNILLTRTVMLVCGTLLPSTTISPLLFQVTLVLSLRWAINCFAMPWYNLGTFRIILSSEIFCSLDCLFFVLSWKRQHSRSFEIVSLKLERASRHFYQHF